MYLITKTSTTIGLAYGPLPPVAVFDECYEALVNNIVNHLNTVDPDGELLNTLEGPHVGSGT